MRLSDRPVLAAAAGAGAIASSGMLVRLADVSPVTAAVFRCLYAVPVLLVLTIREDRRLGPRSRRDRGLAVVAGVFFALDLVLWHHSIEYVGAGIATVLGNLQVVVVGFLAWWALGERPSNRLVAAVPVVLVGVVLISGVVGSGAYGSDPALGVVFGLATSVAYGLFILVLREGSRDLRRIAGPLCDATATAAVAAALMAPVAGGVDLRPHWPAHGWLLLLALSSQVLGWLLIATSLPRVPAALTSLILLLQPVAAIVLNALVLDERPSPVQITGAVVILGGVLWAASARRPRPAPTGTAPSARISA